MTIKTTWVSKNFCQLSLEELYDLLKLRSDIFVVEQTCIYPDLDSEKNNLDRHDKTIHLLGYRKNKLVAYLRILAKGQSYPNHISIGRVITSINARKEGLGHELLQQGLTLCKQYFTNENIKISAQEHLISYYERHGFIQRSAMYLEDGIPHIAMTKEMFS